MLDTSDSNDERKPEAYISLSVMMSLLCLWEMTRIIPMPTLRLQQDSSQVTDHVGWVWAYSVIRGYSVIYSRPICYIFWYLIIGEKRYDVAVNYAMNPPNFANICAVWQVVAWNINNHIALWYTIKARALSLNKPHSVKNFIRNRVRKTHRVQIQIY